MPSHHDKDFRRFLTSDHEKSWQLLNKKLFFLKFRFFLLQPSTETTTECAVLSEGSGPKLGLGDGDKDSISKLKPVEFDIKNVDPRFIVETRPAAASKNMKLRKSRFRFGSFAFGHSTPAQPVPNPIHLPAPSFSVSTDPYFGHDRDQLRAESKFR